MKQRLMAMFLAATLVLGAAACSNTGQAATSTTSAAASQGTSAEQIALSAGSQTTAATSAVGAATTTPIVVEYKTEDVDAGANETAETVAATIKLAGDSITVDGSGASVKGSVVTITAAGRYVISGKLTDGQIVVDTQDAEKVVLELNGVDITNTTTSPIYVAQAEKVVLTLAEGTQNVVTDGKTYVYADATSQGEATNEPDAAIFSHDDLTINGTGSLTVNANYNNGITSKDDLKITGGTIVVNAVNDGVKGRDSLAVKDGTLTINAGGDGLQANNDTEADQGYVVIDGGTLNITAAQDGIQAETRLEINGGNLTIKAGGGSSAGKTEESGKGLKAGVDIVVLGGVVQVDSGDDAVNSNSTVTIGGGDLTLTTGDDGIRANVAFTLSGGKVDITKSYEGVESETITINAGELSLVSQDDGVNGTDNSTVASGGQFGGGMESGASHLYINGGYVAVNSGGDGIDINGAFDMTGGTVLVNGPTQNMNGALDASPVTVTGGLLVAAGSAGMAVAPGATSTQYTIVHTFSAAQAAGTVVSIKAQDGKEIISFTATKTFQSLVVSSPDLVKGGTYVVYSGGQQVASYTLNSVVTGATGGMMGGGMGRGRRP